MLNKISSFWKAIVGPSVKKNQGSTANGASALGCTPTYQLIARDLDAQKRQVFEATVYYLCMIAGLKPDYRAEILEILADYVKTHPNLTDRISYIEQLVIHNNLSSSYTQLKI